MRRRGKAGIGAIVVALLATVGVAGTGVAHASGVTIAVSPATGLSDGQFVSVTITGANVIALGRVYIVECGNAYANGEALSTVVDPDQDCTTLNWMDSPFTPLSIPIKETGIGEGNRSCIAAGLRPCFVWGPTGLNEPALPTNQATVSFAHDPTGLASQPSVTSTTLTPVGSPVATGKVQHLRVQVHDDVFRPNGTITVTEGATTVATGAMIDGVADLVVSSSLGLGSHTLVAHYPGDGSFVGSDSPPTTLRVVGPNNISIGDVSIVAGNVGTRNMLFPVVLSNGPASPVTIPYSIVPGTAQPGVDYVAPKPTAALKFTSIKQTIKYISVKLLNDTAPSGRTLSFTVHLGTPTLGTFVLRDADGAGTIYDQSTSGPTVNIGDTMMPEGDTGGAHTAKFPVTLSVPPTHTTLVTVRIYTGLSQDALKARSGVGDYNARYTFVLTFLPGVGTHPGSTVKVVGVPIYPDLKDEGDETFTVDIPQVVSDPAQVFTVGRGTATGTILSDE